MCVLICLYLGYIRISSMLWCVRPLWSVYVNFFCVYEMHNEVFWHLPSTVQLSGSTCAFVSLLFILVSLMLSDACNSDSSLRPCRHCHCAFPKQSLQPRPISVLQTWREICPDLCKITCWNAETDVEQNGQNSIGVGNGGCQACWTTGNQSNHTASKNSKFTTDLQVSVD